MTSQSEADKLFAQFKSMVLGGHLSPLRRTAPSLVRAFSAQQTSNELRTYPSDFHVREDSNGNLAIFGPSGTKIMTISPTGYQVLGGLSNTRPAGTLSWLGTDANGDVLLNVPTGESFIFRTNDTPNLSITAGKIDKYNAIATASLGLEPIYKENISATLTATTTPIGSYTPPATAGRYKIGGALTFTSGTNTGTANIRVSYVDSQGTTHTSDVLPLTGALGTIVQSGTGSSKEFAVVEREITIDNSATAIVFDTVVSGTVAFTITTYVKQVA